MQYVSYLWLCVAIVTLTAYVSLCKFQQRWFDLLVFQFVLQQKSGVKVFNYKPWYHYALHFEVEGICSLWRQPQLWIEENTKVLNESSLHTVQSVQCGSVIMMFPNILMCSARAPSSKLLQQIEILCTMPNNYTFWRGNEEIFYSLFTNSLSKLTSTKLVALTICVQLLVNCICTIRTWIYKYIQLVNWFGVNTFMT